MFRGVNGHINKREGNCNRMAKRGLGKGLDSLIPDKIVDKTPPGESGKAVLEGGSLVKIELLEPNRDQPRKDFEENSLQELAASIRQFGLLQPILVQPRDGYYEIVAGERRWRAAKLAGLKEVPVIVRELTGQEVLEISLIENLQREDLNPIEEARAYQRLLQEFHLKQEEVAERVSKSRAAVANSLRLLNLCDGVQKLLEEGSLSTGHARALLAVEDAGEQLALAERVIAEKRSVRDVEKMVKTLRRPATAPRASETEEPSRQRRPLDKRPLDAVYREIEERIRQALGTKVSIRASENGSGSIEIEFYGNEDLERLMEHILKP